ncbi:hypothetical protein Tco_0713548 [Tanacetum coccineum]
MVATLRDVLQVNHGHKSRLKIQKDLDAKIRKVLMRLQIVQLILFIVDSGCTKHMTGNLKLLCNFVEKFLGTVRFGNGQYSEDAPFLNVQMTFEHSSSSLGLNGKPSMIDLARLPNTANGCKPKPRNWQASMSSREPRMDNIEYPSYSTLQTNSGFKCSARMVSQKMSYIKWRLLKITLQAPFLNVQKTSVHISSGLVLHQMTSDHNRSELGIQDHSNEQSSSKLVPKVVPLVVKTATSRQELELLFHHHIAMLRTTCKYY